MMSNGLRWSMHVGALMFPLVLVFPSMPKGEIVGKLVWIVGFY
jgi:hypothetical protein